MSPFPNYLHSTENYSFCSRPTLFPCPIISRWQSSEHLLGAWLCCHIILKLSEIITYSTLQERRRRLLRARRRSAGPRSCAASTRCCCSSFSSPSTPPSRARASRDVKQRVASDAWCACQRVLCISSSKLSTLSTNLHSHSLI